MAGEGNRLRMRANRWSRDTKPVTSDTDWITNENATLSHVAGTVLRLRVNCQRVTPMSTLSTAFGLWYTKNGGADTVITTVSSNIHSVPSSFYAHQDPCLNLFLSGGGGAIIDSDNGMHVTGAIFTESFSFPAAGRRFESEWCIRVRPEDVIPGDAFRFIMKRQNGDDFELSPFQTADLTIVAAGAIDGEGNLGATVEGSGAIGETVGGQSNLAAAVRGSGSVAGTVQGAGYLGPAVRGSGTIRPEGS